MIWSMWDLIDYFMRKVANEVLGVFKNRLGGNNRESWWSEDAHKVK